MTTPKTLTLTALSEYVGIKKRTLYNMIADHRFPVRPIKGTNPRRWNVDAVNDWMNKK